MLQIIVIHIIIVGARALTGHDYAYACSSGDPGLICDCSSNCMHQLPQVLVTQLMVNLQVLDSVASVVYVASSKQGMLLYFSQRRKHALLTTHM